MKLRLPLVCVLLLSGLASSQAYAQREAAKEESSTFEGSVPKGGALSEPEIIILLQAKVPLDVIEKFVSARGVNFVSSKDTSRKILAAGGNVSLIGTVNLNQKDEAPAPDLTANGKKKAK